MTETNNLETALTHETTQIEKASTTSSVTEALSGMMPFILILIVFYFLLIRPQQKKMKQHQLMVNDLKKGDKIILNSGIFGVVVKVDAQSNVATVEIAENVKIKVKREAISNVIQNESELAKKPQNADERKIDA